MGAAGGGGVAELVGQRWGGGAELMGQRCGGLSLWDRDVGGGLAEHVMMIVKLWGADRLDLIIILNQSIVSFSFLFKKLFIYFFIYETSPHSSV